MAEYILVVEDEDSIRELICFHLKKEGYAVLEASDGKEAMKVLVESAVQLVILDWMLPELDGLEVCREMAKHSKLGNIPVIMLTAKSEETDKVVGLEMGADDYVTKPFSPRELMSRIKAVLRRSHRKEKETQEWKMGPLTVNFTAHEACLKDKKLDLAPKEYDLLKLFVTHLGRAFSRQEILEKIWGYDYFGETRTVDVHIRHLRAKLGESPEIADRIETVRNIGYRMRA